MVDTKSVHMLNVEPLLLPPGVGWLSVGAQLWRSSAGDRQGPSILEIYPMLTSIFTIFREGTYWHILLVENIFFRYDTIIKVGV